MNPADPLRKSRMMRVVRQYVDDGWLNRSALANLANATEGDIDALIERGRARKEKAEGGGSEERKQQKEAKAEAAKEAEVQEAEEEPAVAPRPGPPKKPQKEGAEPMPENQISEQEFFDKFPKGTHVNYDGIEYVVVGHDKASEGESPSLEAVAIDSEEELTLQEFHDGEFDVTESPRKLPSLTEYPPQVFLIAKVVEGNALAEVYLNHGELLAAHADIEGDTIMEAISDPGEPQAIDGGTIVYTSLGD